MLRGVTAGVPAQANPNPLYPTTDFYVIMMDKETFWELINYIDREALHNGDDEEAVEPLVHALTHLTIPKIEAFENHIAQSLYDIDGEIYATHAGASEGSDDAFLYCRCYVVAQGREYYEAVKLNPSRMPKQLEHWFEPLLYVSEAAWSSVTGRDSSEWEFESSVSYETGSNSAHWLR